MATSAPRRRRSDAAEFLETDVDIDVLGAHIFGRYAGAQRLSIDGVQAVATFFTPEYCPDYRVMLLAGTLARAINRHAQQDPDTVAPLRVTIRDIMLAALLHDLGKHHEDCAPFMDRMRHVDLRGDTAADAERRAHLLGLVRDTHCRKGPCMIDRLRDADRPELHNPFIVTVARRHGDDYAVNRTACWWPREINVITIADDYDAMISDGPERSYKTRPITPDQAVDLLDAGAHRGRYDAQLVDIFTRDVLGQAGA